MFGGLPQCGEDLLNLVSEMRGNLNLMENFYNEVTSSFKVEYFSNKNLTGSDWMQEVPYPRWYIEDSVEYENKNLTEFIVLYTELSSINYKGF